VALHVLALVGAPQVATGLVGHLVGLETGAAVLVRHAASSLVL
jgi:hypothetical protein